jgi:hypothetical protein
LDIHITVDEPASPAQDDSFRLIADCIGVAKVNQQTFNVIGIILSRFNVDKLAAIFVESLYRRALD